MGPANPAQSCPNLSSPMARNSRPKQAYSSLASLTRGAGLPSLCHGGLYFGAEMHFSPLFPLKHDFFFYSLGTLIITSPCSLPILSLDFSKQIRYFSIDPLRSIDYVLFSITKNYI
jgi:hypothetical protein